MPTVQDAIEAWQREDYAAARAVCGELAEADPHARYMLASMISFGQGGDPDPAAAAEHYRIAAEAGHVAARFNLGALYAQGRGVPQDFAEAIRWYKLAAAGGHPEAMRRVGIMYAGGEGVPRDVGHAAWWYFKAWNEGVDEAGNDLARVRRELEAAAEGGDPVAQNALGVILRFGHNDPAAAAAWFEKAAARDHPEALRMLGVLAGEGSGVPKDEARAAELYRRAAELGDMYAQFNLAGMIDQGLGGLQRDISQAIKWFRRAADQGMEQANLRLAELLAERNRDRRDANEAVQRLWRAASTGPADAEYRISAGDGSWSVAMKDQGRTVAMPGLKMEELVGLPDEE